MKYLALTLCLAGSLGLAACNTTNQYSGANYANGRTAGEQTTEYVAVAKKKAPAKVERVFKSQLSK